MNNILSRSNTTKEVLSRIRTDIILRVFKNGEPIRELALSEQYGVSRSAVRNALLVLEQESLIRTLDNGTKVVSCIEPEDIQNLYDLREHIELTSIKQLFSLPNKDFTPIMEVTSRIASSPGLDVTEILEIDAQFHRSIIVCCRNKALLQAWETMIGVMQSIFHLNMTQSREYEEWFLQSFYDRHTRLFTTLLGPPEESIRQFAQHIEDAREISAKAIAQVLKSSKQ
ncbi:GntR family transcriptional regulator [Paenibacillus thalictri]|uniref:GntR family transcriptional regulator n=1 Tax=Paenibacillus thalictri TaxID=2527873 RepID=A0A4V2J318_9BACL|nr:GntR family transcriptional regulator [Paenibacillus thalictri]TBL69111.1 GntR family transcriptional regulator [Paenibacillus thalictri]